MSFQESDPPENGWSDRFLLKTIEKGSGFPAKKDIPMLLSHAESVGHATVCSGVLTCMPRLVPYATACSGPIHQFTAANNKYRSTVKVATRFPNSSNFSVISSSVQEEFVVGEVVGVELTSCLLHTKLACKVFRSPWAQFKSTGPAGHATHE